MALPSSGLNIVAARDRVAQLGSYEALLLELLDWARRPEAHAVYTSLDAASVLAAVRACDAATSAQRPKHGLALHGLPVSIKDLFDEAGVVTAAGSIIRANDAPAVADAMVVARLKSAGAVITGRTNMTEFAFSGVGINPHHGTPRNPCDAAVHRIPGGSSSGAAVSVALGLAVAGLGSDTGGSLRIPAALCGLVGFKPTQSRVPRDGAFELSRSLDSVGAITNNVADAITFDAVIADEPLHAAPADLSRMRFALPQTVLLDSLEPKVSQAYEAALRRLRDEGATLIEIALAELAEVPKLNTPGGIVGTEAYAVHRAYVDERRADFDPRVAARIDLARNVSAADTIQLHDRRRAWIARVEHALQGFDAFLCPTVPITAPAVQPLIDSTEEFFRINALLLRNPSLVNYLDGCAFSLPCHAAGEMPVGLMVASTRGRDQPLASIALMIEAVLARA